jgi:hypothetical protein
MWPTPVSEFQEIEEQHRTIPAYNNSLTEVSKYNPEVMKGEPLPSIPSHKERGVVRKNIFVSI